MAVSRKVLAPASTPHVVPTMLPAGVEEKGSQLLAPLTPSVEALEVHTPEDYEGADRLLARVQTARKSWKVEMYGPESDPKKQTGPIPNIRRGLDQLYELNRRIDSPLEALETTIKGKMKAFKQEEQRLIQEGERAKQAEIDRLQREADALAAKAIVAPTPQLAGRFANQASRLDDKVEEIKATPVAEPVQAFSSRVRTAKKWRIAKMSDFLAACLDGTYGPEWATFSPEAKVTLDALLKSDPDSLAAYPGIEIYDDINIVGR